VKKYLEILVKLYRWRSPQETSQFLEASSVAAIVVKLIILVLIIVKDNICNNSFADSHNSNMGAPLAFSVPK